MSRVFEVTVNRATFSQTMCIMRLSPSVSRIEERFAPVTGRPELVTLRVHSTLGVTAMADLVKATQSICSPSNATHMVTLALTEEQLMEFNK